MALGTAESGGKRGLFEMSRSQSRCGLGPVSKGLLGGNSGHGLGKLLQDTGVSRLIHRVVVDLALLGMRVLGLDRGGSE